MAHTTTGTSKMRPSVMRFGIFKVSAPVDAARPKSDARRFERPSITAVLALRLLRFPTYDAARTRAAMAEPKRGLTYAQAGVDIDAGNRMVELIKPLVRATARRGADAEIGGFGGLFDLKRAGFHRPGAGRRHRRRRHQAQDRDRDRPPRHDRHRSGRHVGQRSRRARRRAAVFSRLLRLRQARPGNRRRRWSPGIADGCRRPAAR